MRLLIAIVALCALFAAPADARIKPGHVAAECNVTMPCDFSYEKKPVRVVHVQHQRITPKPHKYQEKPQLAVAAQITHQSTVVANPEGCPRTAFCGCGAALRVFGHQVRRLWLAANWFGFPRAAPAPGMVAVRRHHVFVLETQLERGLWLVYDANSGRHLTRVHVRSIAGYTIVNPHSG